ncbi:Hpt domain-containing protein [Pseudoxanthomonas sp. X-1]|uniref:Hpt domain-containing protein n=1 Tax=Pseudoxanthomonas sp. X-1 TaxID=2571115 RepID=UPI00110BED82|nr:Hpt domain-containing protein [Pseudoxanthomonas sp. X-1]TMN20268.1 response regulator [Pseudoxanthomonas sp. X-1]UAY73542.1 Hpt domain-containing protein [Pseudoxanthomonas sp. X-1]
MSALREAMSHAVLGWVKPELDQTLRLVRGEIESFAEHPEDVSRMHVCVGYLHQVQGTLHMVELYAPAMVAEELEKLAQALQDGQVADPAEGCATLMRGTVLLPDYLERLQSGHRDIPIVLLPLLNEIRAARGEPGLSESVLFAPDLSRPLPQDVPATEPLPSGTREARFAQAGEHLERIFAGWPQDAAPTDASALAAALMPLQRLAEHTAARRMLWVASSVAEALRDGALRPSPALHQGFAAVLRAVRQLRQGLVPGAAPGQEPTRLLLYQVAQTDARHPALEDLRRAFDLSAASPSQAEIEHARSSLSGRNRALLDTVGGVVKEELMRVKDALDLQLRTGADIADLAPQVAQLGSVGDTLGMMGLGLARNVVLQQRDSLAELVQGRRTPDESALLDIAGALLYVDASLDDQVAHLGDAGGAPDAQAAESRRTVEALAGEAMRNFAEARQQFVAFIETGWDHAQLDAMPRLLAEVAGALRMLELDEPSDYVEGVRRYIGTELIQRRRVPGGAQLDTLADAMASLEYYLEALREHRPNREEILGITRSSLEALRYWPLPAPAAAVGPAQEAMPAQEGAGAQGAAAPLAQTPSGQADDLTQGVVEAGFAGAPLEIERAPTLPDFEPQASDASAFDPVASEFEGHQATPVEVIDTELHQALERPDALPAFEPQASDASAFDPVASEFDIAPTDATDEEVRFPPSDGELETEARDDRAPAGADLDASAFDSDDDAFAAERAGQADERLLEHDHTAVESLRPDPELEAQLPSVSQPAFAYEPDTAASAQSPVTPAPEQPAASPASALQQHAPAQSADAPALAAGFEVSGHDIDDEIRDVFLEEFDEEIGNLRQLLPLWLAKPEDLERLRPIRRVFHTLKGSGRLVGARLLGEFSWKIENMLNRVLDGSRPPSPAVQTLLQQATDTLPQLDEALRGRAGVQADLAGIEAIAERLAAGEEAWYAAAPASETPVAVAAQDESEAAPPAASSDGTPATVDSVLREILETEVANHLQVVDAWLAQARNAQSAAASEPLLRAFHTINGAFAMADVPEIIEVTGRAEQYIKRLLANQVQADPAGVEGLASAAAAVRATIVALQGPQPRIPQFMVLRALLEELRDGLPAAQRLSSTAVEDHGQSTYATLAPAGVLKPEVPGDLELTGAMDLSRFVDGHVEFVPTLDAFEPPAPHAPPVDDGHATWFDLRLDYQAERPVRAMAEPPVPTFEAPLPPELAAFDTGAPPAEGEADDVSLEAHAERDVGIDPDLLTLEDLPDTADDADVQALADADDLSEEERAELEALDHVPADGDVALTEPEAASEAMAWYEHAQASEPAASVEPDAGEPPVAEVSEVVQAGPVALEAAAETAEDAPLEIAPVDVQPESPAETAAQDDYAPEALFAEGQAEDIEALDGAAGHGASHDVAHAPATAASAADDAAQSLDFSVLDRDLVDIFVEEGNDLLDHSDGLLARLRQAPDDRSLVIGLQRDLHTIKGGARMAGIEPIGDLGHAIESLLEQVAEHRADVDRGVIGLLERGFDALHGMLERTAAYRIAAAQPELVAEFDARARGEVVTDARAAEVAPFESPVGGEPRIEDVSFDDVAPLQAATPEATAPDHAPLPIDATPAADAEAARAQHQDDGAGESAADREGEAFGFGLAPEDQGALPAEPAEMLEAADEALPDSQDAEAFGFALEDDAGQAPQDPAATSVRSDDAPPPVRARESEAETPPPAKDEAPAEPSPAPTSDYLDADLLAALDVALGTSYANAIRQAQAERAASPSTEPASDAAFVDAAPFAAAPADAAPEPPPASTEPVAESPAPAAMPALLPQPIPELPPLSAPLDLHGQGEDEQTSPGSGQEQVRVRADLLDQLVNHAGEVAIYRARLEQQMGAFRAAMAELDRTNTRLHDQLRRLDLETEAQIVARYQREQDTRETAFDPLELDRFSTLQQLSRALAESAADISGLQSVLDELARQNDSLLGQQSRVSSELQDGLMRARMVPFEGSVPRLRRVLRQAAADTGKQAQLQLEGAHGELDRNVLERMTAPLEHLLRNAVAHGLESPQARRAAGKPEEGTVRVVLRREGSEMVLQVADDGAGIDHAAIRRRAELRGMLQPGAEIADVDLERLILEPGFSTAEEVSQLAGRGVGMDVVHNEVRQLGGSLEIDSTRGQGTRFTLRLPQTLAVTQAVFVQIGETQFAVPVAAVGGVGRISRDRYESGSGSYVYGGEEYALHDLGTLVGQAPARAEGQPQVPLLLVRAGELRAAVAVDQVLGNREIVVKPVGPQIGSIPGIYGATITGDGSVVVILDAAPLVRRYIAQPVSAVPASAQVEQRHVPLVMVVDDSLTMRKVTGRVLERHNFEVATARDGIEALERLEERVPDLMLLDIEMPRMDGYELATAMRADPRFAGVPIVMITSRTGDKHRQRALEIGVQRYMGKPYQELDLMRNVYDLLGIARVRD